MNGSSWAETRRALAGTLLLAGGERTALDHFDASLGGFWRSFRAAAICFPFYLLLAFDPLGGAHPVARSSLRMVAVDTIAYVISWTAFPLIILKLCRWIDRDDRFFAFMVAYNWCQVPQVVLFAAIALAATAGLPAPLVNDAIAPAATAAVLVYEWFIARVALNASLMGATLVVVVDLLLATILSQVTDSLH